MLVCLATSRGEDVKSQPQKTCFRAPRGALERWFGGPTRSPTCTKIVEFHVPPGVPAVHVPFPSPPPVRTRSARIYVDDPPYHMPYRFRHRSPRRFPLLDGARYSAEIILPRLFPSHILSAELPSIARVRALTARMFSDSLSGPIVFPRIAFAIRMSRFVSHMACLDDSAAFCRAAL